MAESDLELAGAWIRRHFMPYDFPLFLDPRTLSVLAQKERDAREAEDG